MYWCLVIYLLLYLAVLAGLVTSVLTIYTYFRFTQRPFISLSNYTQLRSSNVPAREVKPENRRNYSVYVGAGLAFVM